MRNLHQRRLGISPNICLDRTVTLTLTLVNNNYSDPKLGHFSGKISRHLQQILHCVSKHDTDVAHYDYNAHQPILVIFGGDVAQRECYRMVISYPTSLNYVSALPGETRAPKIVYFQSYRILKTHRFGLLYLRQSSTNFNNFWHVIASGTEPL